MNWIKCSERLPEADDLLYAARLILGSTNSNSSCTLHEQKDGEK